MKRTPIVLLGIVLLVFFTLFSRSIKQGGMKDLDFATTVKLQERIDHSSRLRLSRLTGEIMEGATFFASPMVSVIAVIIITFIAGTKRKKWKLIALCIPIIFTLMIGAEIYGKSVVHHPAPPFFLLKNPTTVFPKYYIWEDFSYPSGHAARAAFISMIIWLLTVQQYNKTAMTKRLWLTAGLTIYVVLISLSRIYLGHHWLSDVIGGILLGAGSGLLTNAILIPYNQKRNE